MKRLGLVKPSLQGTTWPQTLLHLPLPQAPNCRSPNPQPPTGGTTGTFPWRTLFPPSCSPTSHAAPKTSLPVLSPCKGGFPCSLHDLAPTHLPPISRHVSSSYLSCQTGRRAIRVPTLGQHHINAEKAGEERYKVCCVALLSQGQRRRSVSAQGLCLFTLESPRAK